MAGLTYEELITAKQDDGPASVLTDPDGVPYDVPPGTVHATERPDLVRPGPCWFAVRHPPGITPGYPGTYDWFRGEIVGPSDAPGRWIVKGTMTHRALTHLAFDVEG